MKMDQKTNLQRICVFVYVTLLKGRVKVTSTGCTAASFSLLVYVTSSCVWRGWMERTSHVQRSTSRPSTSPTCWSAKLRWSYPATWPTGLDTNTQQRKITWASFLKLSGFYVCCGNIQQSLLYAPHQSSSDTEEEEKECNGLLAALVVCVPGLVPPAVHQRGVHFLHPVVRFWIRQRKVHQVGHVSGPLAVPEHLYTAAPQGVLTPSSHFPKFNGDIVVPSGSKTSFCF